jgi:hypothetical protein
LAFSSNLVVVAKNTLDRPPGFPVSGLKVQGTAYDPGSQNKYETNEPHQHAYPSDEGRLTCKNTHSQPNTDCANK